MFFMFLFAFLGLVDCKCQLNCQDVHDYRREGISLIVLEAQANKERIELEADAKRKAILMVAETLKTEEGRRAQDFLLAKEYLDTLMSVLPNSQMNTVFVPENLGDIPKMMSTAMGLLGSSKT